MWATMVQVMLNLPLWKCYKHAFIVCCRENVARKVRLGHTSLHSTSICLNFASKWRKFNLLTFMRKNCIFWRKNYLFLLFFLATGHFQLVTTVNRIKNYEKLKFSEIVCTVFTNNRTIFKECILHSTFKFSTTYLYSRVVWAIYGQHQWVLGLCFKTNI